MGRPLIFFARRTPPFLRSIYDFKPTKVHAEVL
jgi:hypothetical protein